MTTKLKIWIRPLLSSLSFLSPFFNGGRKTMTDLEGHMLVCHWGENSTTYTQHILFQNIHPSTKCIKSSENIPFQDCSSESISSDKDKCVVASIRPAGVRCVLLKNIQTGNLTCWGGLEVWHQVASSRTLTQDGHEPSLNSAPFQMEEAGNFFTVISTYLCI